MDERLQRYEHWLDQRARGLMPATLVGIVPYCVPGADGEARLYNASRYRAVWDIERELREVQRTGASAGFAPWLQARAAQEKGTAREEAAAALAEFARLFPG